VLSNRKLFIFLDLLFSVISENSFPLFAVPTFYLLILHNLLGDCSYLSDCQVDLTDAGVYRKKYVLRGFCLHLSNQLDSLKDTNSRIIDYVKSINKKLEPRIVEKSSLSKLTYAPGYFPEFFQNDINC
jgi:hypothetical protein